MIDWGSFKSLQFQYHLACITEIFNKSVQFLFCGVYQIREPYTSCDRFSLNFKTKSYLVFFTSPYAGMGNIRPARPFYAARRHLQKYKLLSRIKPRTFYFFIEHLRTSRPYFALHRRSVFRGRALFPAPPPLLTLLFSTQEQK